MEKKTLHLLIVDDSPDDADVPVRALRTYGFMLRTQRVQDMVSMQLALEKGEWDVVIAKHAVPHFSTQRVLDSLKRANSALPLIVYADKLSELEIASVMRAGARDVMLKSELARLGPAVERELAVVRERSEHRRLHNQFQEIENKHQAMIDGSREAVCYSHEGMHVEVNRAYLTLFGYDDLEELEGVPVLDLIEKSNHARFKEYLRKALKKGQKTGEPQQFLALQKDGSRISVEVSLSLIDIGGESCTQIVVNDASKRAMGQLSAEGDELRDPLTGAYQRADFLRELGSAIEHARAGGGSCALLYLEVDGLKEINEKAGMEMGDRFLQELGRCFQDALDNDALLSRFGGDEFAVLLRTVTHRQAHHIAERLQQCVTAAAGAAGVQVHAPSCTLGQIMIEKTAGSVEQVLSWAYSACEQAKKQKKNVAPAAAALRTRQAAESEPAAIDDWRERIQRALDRDGFQLVYQPLINLIGDPSEYYEVLIRMTGDEELIAAGAFMPIAEQSGQVQAIDRWVVEHALRGLADLHQNGQQSSFFVNLSSQTLQDESLITMIRETLQVSKLPAKHLILEIDESVLNIERKLVDPFMQGVKKLGCRLSLDNFSARLASLNALRALPIEFVKIDGVLVRDAAKDNVKQLVLKTIVQVAKLLDMKTIGKCIEDEDTLSLLYSYELDYLQGNYFQQADSQPAYGFAGETTLSSDSETPGWPPP